jgi:hypothetical protein
MNLKNYRELVTLTTFEDRLRYLMTRQAVGDNIWGSRRRYNQLLYTSPEWKAFRQRIIIRDNGNDLAMPGYELHGGLLIHHIVPITLDDIIYHRPCVFDPNNVVLTSVATHRIIHYEKDGSFLELSEDRHPGDTKLW